MTVASELTARLLAARRAGGKASKARRTIDFLAETHLLSDMALDGGNHCSLQVLGKWDADLNFRTAAGFFAGSGGG